MDAPLLNWLWNLPQIIWSVFLGPLMFVFWGIFCGLWSPSYGALQEDMKVTD